MLWWSRNELKTSCICPLKESVGNWYNFFLKGFIEFTNEFFWPVAFYFGRLFVYSISLIDIVY